MTLDDETEDYKPIVLANKRERDVIIDLRYSNPFKKKRRHIREKLKEGKEIYNYKGIKVEPKRRYQSPRMDIVDKLAEVELKEE